MDLVVYDDEEKRYVPWAVALTAMLIVALLTAVLTFLLARQASGNEPEQPLGGVGSPEPATAPSATSSATPSAVPSSAAPSSAAPASAPPIVGPTPAPACVAALLLADAAIEHSVAVDEALAQHTEIMDELLAERIDAQEALDRTLPVLTDGATERRRFEEAATDYRDSREQCPS